MAQRRVSLPRCCPTNLKFLIPRPLVTTLYLKCGPRSLVTSHAFSESVSAEDSSPPVNLKTGYKASEDLDEKERLRRTRISNANAGKEPWNKGRKHSPETIAKIRERTKQAMQREEVNEKVKAGRARQTPVISPEVKERIREKLRAYHEAKRLAKAAEKAAANPDAEPAQPGDALAPAPDAVAPKRRRRTLKQTPEDSAAQPEDNAQATTPKSRRKAPTASSAAMEDASPLPKPPPRRSNTRSPEHRAAIAEAIRRKWRDPAYRATAIQGMRRAAASTTPGGSRIDDDEGSERARRRSGTSGTSRSDASRAAARERILDDNTVRSTRASRARSGASRRAENDEDTTAGPSTSSDSSSSSSRNRSSRGARSGRSSGGASGAGAFGGSGAAGSVGRSRDRPRATMGYQQGAADMSGGESSSAARLPYVQRLVQQVLTAERLVANTEYLMQQVAQKSHAFRNDPVLRGQAEAQLESVRSSLQRARQKLEVLRSRVPPDARYNEKGDVWFVSASGASPSEDPSRAGKVGGSPRAGPGPAAREMPHAAADGGSVVGVPGSSGRSGGSGRGLGLEGDGNAAFRGDGRLRSTMEEGPVAIRGSGATCSSSNGSGHAAARVALNGSGPLNGTVLPFTSGGNYSGEDYDDEDGEDDEESDDGEGGSGGWPGGGGGGWGGGGSPPNGRPSSPNGLLGAYPDVAGGMSADTVRVDLSHLDPLNTLGLGMINGHTHKGAVPKRRGTSGAQAALELQGGHGGSAEDGRGGFGSSAVDGASEAGRGSGREGGGGGLGPRMHARVGGMGPGASCLGGSDGRDDGGVADVDQLWARPPMGSQGWLQQQLDQQASAMDGVAMGTERAGAGAAASAAAMAAVAERDACAQSFDFLAHLGDRVSAGGALLLSEPCSEAEAVEVQNWPRLLEGLSAGPAEQRGWVHDAAAALERALLASAAASNGDELGAGRVGPAAAAADGRRREEVQGIEQRAGRGGSRARGVVRGAVKGGAEGAAGRGGSRRSRRPAREAA